MKTILTIQTEGNSGLTYETQISLIIVQRTDIVSTEKNFRDLNPGHPLWSAVSKVAFTSSCSVFEAS